MNRPGHTPPIPVGTSRSGPGLISVLIVRHSDLSSPEDARHQLSQLTGALQAADLDVVGYAIGRGDAIAEAERILSGARVPDVGEGERP